MFVRSPTFAVATEAEQQTVMPVAQAPQDAQPQVPSPAGSDESSQPPQPVPNQQLADGFTVETPPIPAPTQLPDEIKEPTLPAQPADAPATQALPTAEPSAKEDDTNDEQVPD